MHAIAVALFALLLVFPATTGAVALYNPLDSVKVGSKSGCSGDPEEICVCPSNSLEYITNLRISEWVNECISVRLPP